MGFYICGIYEKRPEVCRKYPESGSYTPPQCTYHFDAQNKRQGFCDPHCQATCCFLPREGGEPGGAPIPEIAGGKPCKHLVYEDKHPALSGDGGGDSESRGDREEDRQGASNVELAVAEINRRKRDRDLTTTLGAAGRKREGG